MSADLPNPWEWVELDPVAFVAEYTDESIAEVMTDMRNEILRLQRVLDGRPAINAALPDSYVAWSQSIYAMEFTRALTPGGPTQ